MPRGKKLSSSEQATIMYYHGLGLKLRDIARRIKRSKTVVLNYIRNPENYGKKKRSGRKPTLSERDIREIKKLAKDPSNSPSDIVGMLNLDVSKRRIQQILKADSNLRYSKIASKPRLTSGQKLARLRFAEKYQFWEEEWSRVIFSDEKKFNLDGPDSSQKYWRDKRQKEVNRMSRNFGGGTLMVWAGIATMGRTPICFISTKMNSERYIELLDGVLIDFSEQFFGDNWTFQQDNASIHNSLATKTFFSSRNIPVLNWPACSPDLNPIENIWAILSKNVFKNNTQYLNVKSLKNAVIEEWGKISQDQIANIINSMPRRLQEVIIQRGGHTHY